MSLRPETHAARLRELGWTVLPPAGWNVAAQANRIVETQRLTKAKKRKLRKQNTSELKLRRYLTKLRFAVCQDHGIRPDEIYHDTGDRWKPTLLDHKAACARIDFVARARLCGYRYADIGEEIDRGLSTVRTYWEKYSTGHTPAPVLKHLMDCRPNGNFGYIDRFRWQAEMIIVNGAIK